MACLIAAPSSGSGKTLLSLCLAAVLRERGEALQPFKVGPDYLDPQLLGAVAGTPCRNLDPVLCGEAWVRSCFAWHGSRAQRVLVEGVMGLFDGVGPGSEGSSAAVAALLGLPVVLVVEASRQAGSLAAVVRGFRDHGPPRVQLAGVVLNRVASPRHRDLLAEALASIDVPLLGVLPPHPSLELPSRHLGLFPAHEVSDLGERGRAMASLARRHLDLHRLLPLLEPPALSGSAQDPLPALLGPPPAGAPLPVAVASDPAFHFRYPEMGELLAAVKLDPIPWSPVANEPLPAGTRAVLLPGGYPELWAEQLAAADRSLADLRRAASAGVPIVAECGGLLLLGRGLADPGGRMHPMAGLLPFEARSARLSLGYRHLTARRDGMLVRAGEVMRGHEFHRWQLEAVPPDSRWAAAGLWQLEGWGIPRSEEGWSAANLHASWIHLHWAGCPRIPRRLAAAVAKAAPNAGS